MDGWTLLPQIEDAHAVLELCLVEVGLEHGDLGLGQRLAALGIQAARVLHARAETGRQHAGADLVVLGVGGIRLHGHGPRAEALNVGHLAGDGIAQGRAGDGCQPVPELAPDADADDGMRQVAAVEDPVCPRSCLSEHVCPSVAKLAGSP